MRVALRRVLLVLSPLRSSFSPFPRVFSQPPLALQPDFYASGASSFLSMICRLLILGSLFCPRFLCFHQLAEDRKSTRLNSSHQIISYAVFCLKKKRKSIQPLLSRA